MTDRHHLPQLDLLLALLRRHSTPGDEDEVRELLAREWRQAGWSVTAHGQFAISARRGEVDPAKPTLLVAAHMDSPGFTVERLPKPDAGDSDQPGEITLIRLGGTRVEGTGAELMVKTIDGHRPALLRKSQEGDKEVFRAEAPACVAHGDRACFRARPQVVHQRFLLSPFLDNRLGCWALLALAHDRDLTELPVNLVLGATTSEEFGGFGAPVLARALAPELTVCLDATYEAPEQELWLGRGPVLTLSDAAVLLGPRRREALRKWFADRELALQTEVYNVSGTDARAFPHQGLTGEVLALLVPTTGNHSACERCHLADLAALLDALRAMARQPPLALTEPLTERS